MGGFVLDSPDYPRFPVNAEQLHYLVKHGYVDFPDITKADIKDLSKTDSLSKYGCLTPPRVFSTTIELTTGVFKESLFSGRFSGSRHPS